MVLQVCSEWGRLRLKLFGERARERMKHQKPQNDEETQKFLCACIFVKIKQKVTESTHLVRIEHTSSLIFESCNPFVVSGCTLSSLSPPLRRKCGMHAVGAKAPRFQRILGSLSRDPTWSPLQSETMAARETITRTITKERKISTFMLAGKTE